MMSIFDRYMAETKVRVDEAYENQDLNLYLIILQAYFWPLLCLYFVPSEDLGIAGIAIFLLALIHIIPAFYGITRFLRSVNEAFNNNRQTKIREYNK